MTRPVVSNWTEQAYGALEPYTGPDEAFGWPFLVYIGSMGDTYFQPVDDLARDHNGRPGWADLVDVDVCPAYALPWLGQLVGVQVDTTLSEDNQRSQIRSVEGFSRGRPSAIIAAAKLYLTGAKFVNLQERLNGDAYQIGINTHTAETPADTTAMLAAIEKVTPAGMKIIFNTFVGQTWGAMKTTAVTWGGVRSTWATWDAVRQA